MIELGHATVVSADFLATSPPAAIVEVEAAVSDEDLCPPPILPSMTIDPADTKTPYSDATQVSWGSIRKRANERALCVRTAADGRSARSERSTA